MSPERPDSVLRKSTVRVAVLTDAHVSHVADEQSDYLRQAVAQVACDAPDFVVFNGDLMGPPARNVDTHAIERLLEPCDVPVYVLRGNSDLPSQTPDACEQARFSFDFGGFAFVGFDTSHGTLAEPQKQWLDCELRRHHGRPVVLFTHYYPDALGFDEHAAAWLMNLLAETDVHALICGHGHRNDRRFLGKVQRHMVAAVDPFKAHSHEPGYELFVFAGETVDRTRHRTSLVARDVYRHCMGCLSCAARKWGDLQTLEHVLRADELRHIQFHKALIDQYHNGVERICHWRDDGVIDSVSVHASNPKVGDDGSLLNQPAFDDELEMCRRLDAEAVNVHLPLWDDRLVFEPDGSPKDNTVAMSLVEAMAKALHGFWSAGIRIELENFHWYDPRLMPDRLGQHQLGIKIHHLLYFRKELERLLQLQYGPVDRAQVRFCFDVGHAMTNGPLMSEMTIQHWLTALHDYITAIHFHDIVERSDLTRQAHFPIGVEGGILGIEGFLHLKHKYAPSARLHLELGDLPAIHASVQHLRCWGRQRRLS